MSIESDKIRAKARDILLEHIIIESDSDSLKRLKFIVERSDTINAMIEFSEWHNTSDPQKEADSNESNCDIKHVRSLLIGALYGWKDYQAQGVSIEDYVDEIIDNL